MFHDNFKHNMFQRFTKRIQTYVKLSRNVSNHPKPSKLFSKIQNQKILNSQQTFQIFRSNFETGHYFKQVSKQFKNSFKHVSNQLEASNQFQTSIKQIQIISNTSEHVAKPFQTRHEQKNELVLQNIAQYYPKIWTHSTRLHKIVDVLKRFRKSHMEFPSGPPSIENLLLLGLFACKNWYFEVVFGFVSVKKYCIRVGRTFLRQPYYMAPSRGLSTPRSLKVKPNKKLKNNSLVTRYMFFLRMCNILCMREAVTISIGSHILPSPLGF